MEELAEAQLAILDRDSRKLVRTAGPAFLLSPRTAEVLGMALHELATNALRHGALAWRRAGRPVMGGARRAPVRRLERDRWPAGRGTAGLGLRTTLIRHIPARSLKADVALDYAPDGLTWRLSCDATLAKTLAS
jgi:two-component sensor histidine kinase